MTADLRNKLPHPFTLVDVMELTQDRPDAILITEGQSEELYALLRHQVWESNPPELADKRKVTYHGMRVEVA